MSRGLLTSLACAALTTGSALANSAGAAVSLDRLPGVKVPAFERTVLVNGLTLIVMPRRDFPLIAFSAVLRGGAADDPADKAGVASLVAGLLEKGAGARDAFGFADAVENAGGSFSAGAGAESIGISGQFLARDRELMVELLADALQRPRFEGAEFEKLRARRIEFIRAAKDSDPSQLLGSYGRALLFGAHPFARPAAGSERSLAAIAPADVTDYARRHFGADRLTIVITGDVDPAWARTAITRAFGQWSKAATPVPSVPAPARLGGRRVLIVDSPGAEQTYFWVGNLGVARSFARRAPLDVANTLYGGRFTSILNTKLRIESGLSYGASSSFTRASVPGEFAITSFVQTENTGKALAIVLDSLASLKADGVPAALLDSGRAYVLGQYPLRLETAANWADALGDLEFFRLDRAYIESYLPSLRQVTLDDTRRVIAEVWPDPADLAIVLIGDAAKIRADARALGPVVEMPFAAPDFAPPVFAAPAR